MNVWEMRIWFYGSVARYVVDSRDDVDSNWKEMAEQLFCEAYYE